MMHLMDKNIPEIENNTLNINPLLLLFKKKKEKKPPWLLHFASSTPTCTRYSEVCNCKTRPETQRTQQSSSYNSHRHHPFILGFLSRNCGLPFFQCQILIYIRRFHFSRHCNCLRQLKESMSPVAYIPTYHRVIQLCQQGSRLGHIYLPCFLLFQCIFCCELQGNTTTLTRPSEYENENYSHFSGTQVKMTFGPYPIFLLLFFIWFSNILPSYALRWLILASYYFFPGISNALRTQGGANTYKSVLNICNAFETLKTWLKY